MREQFFKQSMIRAGISFFLGLIISFCSFTYIALYIYTDGYNLRLPIILLFIGLIMQGWGIYKIKVVGKISDDSDADTDTDLFKE